MGVQISDIPTIAFSQNEIAVTLTSDDYLASVGVAAVYILRWDIEVAEDDQIIISIGGKSGTIIIAKDDPDDSGEEIPTQGTMSYEEYIPILIEALKKNYVLSSMYYITPGDEFDIHLTARGFGSVYDIMSGGQNFSIVQLVASVENIVQTNFYHYLEIWANDERIYNSLLPLNYPVSGKTTIDIASIVHASLSFDIPSLTDLWQVCDKSILRYSLRYANAWGEPSSINGVIRGNELVAVIGGYSRMALAHITDTKHLEKHLLADPSLYQSQRWFESYPVDEVEVKTNQPQFLYFINSRSESETLRIQVEATKADASTSQITLAGGELAPYGKVCVAVGYKQLGLDALSAEENKIVSYTVQLIGADNHPRTVIKTFRINRCYEANTRYFLFAGSDGNFKTLRTYGSADPSVEFERESGVTESNQAAKIQFGDVLTFDVVSYENEVVSTGYVMSRHTHESIKEFMLSTRVFRVIGEKLIPIEILSSGMPLPLELRKTGFVKIEYRLAWDEKLYTGDTSALNVPSIAQSQEALNDI